MPEPEADKLPKDELTKRLRPRRSAAMIVKTVVVLLTAGRQRRGHLFFAHVDYQVQMRTRYISFVARPPRSGPHPRRNNSRGRMPLPEHYWELSRSSLTLWSNQPRRSALDRNLLGNSLCRGGPSFSSGRSGGSSGSSSDEGQVRARPLQSGHDHRGGAAFGFFLAVFAKVLDRILPPWSRSLP